MKRKKIFFVVTLAVFFCLISSYAFGEEQLPLIKVIATGGTIANTPGEVRLSGEAYIKAIPQISKYARLDVEDFMRVGSSKLGPEHWLKLAKRCNEVFSNEKEVQGIVITIGSNTMPETAYFLNLTVKSDKPIVLVAAQRKFTTLSSDSPKNFLQAIQVASSKKAVGMGVLSATFDVINAARELRKNITYRVETFNSGDVGYLGYVDDYGVEFYRKPLRKHTKDAEFDVSNVAEMPRVDVFYAYGGGAGDYIKYAVEQGKAQGIVMAGFCTGVPSRTGKPSKPWQDDHIKKLVKEYDIPVIMTNRGWIGRVLPEKRRPYYIWGDNLPPQKARILLMIALTKTKDRKEIQRMFWEY
jgi:L-asparaginase